MQVIAEEDNGANGTAEVRIDVENVNDEDPVFQPVQYYANISEGVEADAFIEQAINSRNFAECLPNAMSSDNGH